MVNAQSIIPTLKTYLRPSIIDQIQVNGWTTREALREAHLTGQTKAMRGAGPLARRVIDSVLSGDTSALLPRERPQRISFVLADGEENVARDLLARMVPLSGLWRMVAGVYALKLEGRIIYVGKSLNVAERVPQHIETKRFDSADYVEVFGSTLGVPHDRVREVDSELLTLERALIKYVRPELNRA